MPGLGELLILALVLAPVLMWAQLDRWGDALGRRIQKWAKPTPGEAGKHTDGRGA